MTAMSRYGWDDLSYLDREKHSQEFRDAIDMTRGLLLPGLPLPKIPDSEMGRVLCVLCTAILNLSRDHDEKNWEVVVAAVLDKMEWSLIAS